jgi:hypothetical protein
MKNNFENTKVGDLIIFGKYDETIMIVSLIVNTYATDYDLNCFAYDSIDNLITHFHFRNDDCNVLLIKV